MKIVIRAVGKLRDRRVEALCTEYLDRARRHLPVEVQEVADEASLLDGGGAKGTRVAGETVALDPAGQSFTTEEFRTFIDKRMVAGTRALTFLIGGAEGLSDSTRKAADLRVSLSNLTLPHRLARLLLCEQIYRCLSSIRGEPYNK